MDLIRVEAEVVPVVSHAMAHNLISPVRKVTLRNTGAPRTGVQVQIALNDGQGTLSEPFTAHADLDQGSTTILRELPLRLNAGAMHKVEEARPGALEVTVLHEGVSIATSRQPVTVLAARQWLWKPAGLALEMLAAHIMPNAPEVSAILASSAERLRQTTGSSQVDGYQSGSENVDAIVRAIYETVASWHIRYSEPPASWTDEGQKIRTPGDLQATRLGTCLDTTLLFAAALEQAGLRALVWMLQGHAFVGWWRQEIDSWSVNADVPEVINRLSVGQVGVLETTLATERAVPATFRDALTAAARRIQQEPDSVIGILDVWAARRSHILPLPAITRTEDGTWQTVIYQAAQHSVAPADQVVAGGETVAPAASKATRVPPRVQKWKNALLDLSLRNRLINFNGRAAVRINVSPQRLGTLEDLVMGGRAVALSPGDAFDNVYRHRDGIQRAADLPGEVLDEALVHKLTVFTDLTTDAYVTRLRNLAYKARTVEEETGANNLYLALGTLVWELGDRQLRSPLVLLPVHLKSSGGRGASFRLILDDTGASTPNYCLLEKLRLTFGLTLPTLTQPSSDAHGVDIDSALLGIREELLSSGLPFRVEETADISLLQFAKYRLWKDLEENWDALLNTPLGNHLAYSPTTQFVDPVAGPDHHDLDQLGLLCPVPADGSQLNAIAEAMAGRTFVLEGPPGTGKSQTIANLLARGIAEGKRILFVAEKRAALDVVARRVRAIGLGDFLLDLHDRDSRPARVRQQIGRALDLNLRGDTEGLQARIEHARASGGALTRYAARLHEPNGAGLSLYSAETARKAVGAGATLTLPPHVVAPGAQKTVDLLRHLMTGLPYVADPACPSALGPWSFAQVDDPDGLDVAGVAEASQVVEDRITRLNAAGPLEPVLRAASTPDQLKLLAELLEGGRPPLRLLDEARTAGWRQTALAAQQEVADYVRRAKGILGPATPVALVLPLEDIHRHAMEAAESSWFGRRRRLLAVVEELRPGLAADASVPPKQLTNLVSGLLELQTAMRQLADQVRAVPGVVIPPAWNALEGDAIALLDHQIRWLTWAADQVQPASSQEFIPVLRDFLARADPVPVHTVRALRELAEALAHVQRALSANDEDMRRWSASTGIIGQWQETGHGRDVLDPNLGSLRRWLEFRHHLRPLKEWGLEEAHHELLTGALPSAEAALALERGLAEASIVERRRSQGLAVFDDSAHNRTVSRFCENAESAREALTGALAAEALSRRSFASEMTSGQVGALKRELSRQRGGLSVRELMGRHGGLVTEIMPCALVSPDSLARFFPVDAVKFDMVVFDEASQIRVADAIGAIGRAKSVVVVGDSKQMPPTSVAEITQRLDEDEDDFESGSAIDDEESILTECVLARVQRHWLSWHYRSQDESLISFSNARYYEGRLSSFPAPTRGAADPSIDGHGISHINVHGTFLRSGKGKSLRTNPEEGSAILAEILRRFDATPPGSMPSIGVVTFNLQQRALIESMLRDAGDARIIAALEITSGDGLFVKNLENVQGDERDVILFSTAFSVNDKGVLPLNFGPLNLSGGERRLNVAITRARRQVIIYSSFEPSQLRAEETNSLGIKHLREYLDVAAGGEAELASAAARTLVRDRHRDEIAEQLRERGLSVRTDVGLSDFRVDLQLARTGEPDQPLVAVLLDGPGWARRATVNDRDGMPRQVLASMLGWPAVERIWLPTWLDHPQAVLDRLVQVVNQAETKALRQATAAIPTEDEPDNSPAPFPTPQRSPDSKANPSDRPRLAASAFRETTAPVLEPLPQTGRPPSKRFRPWQPTVVGDVSHLDALANGATARSTVRRLLEEGIAMEGPIHGTRLAKKTANAFGLTRVAQSRIDSILDAGRRRPDRHGFYWPDGMDPREWREYRRDPSQDRLLEHVSPHELANAMREIALLSGGITLDELKKETTELFGFKRLTSGFSDILDRALAVGLETDRLRWEGSLLHDA